MSRYALFVLVLTVFVLSACGGQPAAQPAAGGGNTADGKTLFEKTVIGTTAGCATCHSVVKDKKIVGPSLYGIATDAAGAFKESGYKGTAKSAADWLREAIVSPNVDVVEGFQPGIMPSSYGKDLTTQQINDLVAYLSTLK